MNLERAIQPQITQINANGSVSQAEFAAHPQGDLATDTKSSVICV
jgi:hypothetical protein